MADRFYGTVMIGGRVSRVHYDECCRLLESCLDDDLQPDGSGAFIECTKNDFWSLIQYCIWHRIALHLHWEAGNCEESTAEYWVDGKYRQYFAAGDGDVAIRLAELEEHSNMTVAEFIRTLEVPNFPVLELVEDTPRDITIFNHDATTEQTSALGSDAEIAWQFLGKSITNGDDGARVPLCVHIHDSNAVIGLKVKNIESGAMAQVNAVWKDKVKVDEGEEYEEIILVTKETNYSLKDVWVYDIGGNWLKGIGFARESAN